MATKQELEAIRLQIEWRIRNNINRERDFVRALHEDGGGLANRSYGIPYTVCYAAAYHAKRQGLGLVIVSQLAQRKELEEVASIAPNVTSLSFHSLASHPAKGIPKKDFVLYFAIEELPKEGKGRTNLLRICKRQDVHHFAAKFVGDLPILDLATARPRANWPRDWYQHNYDLYSIYYRNEVT